MKTPYEPSANGQVERTWDKSIQHIAGALRASVNKSTNFTANLLMLDREDNTPAQLMFPPCFL
ncbi:hypothetical protein DPMN_169559 [Dreissena polymorpha]|uniref:Uncharacterized protein n=1 Tax=Dreissena polymorpha TaxID=45954 RepID=A0A9D4DY52_DREPO|nr:hypothetical protein DPMN_169559 [Dreissena polymorpha]